MLKMKWYKHQLSNKEDVIQLIKTFKKVKPQYGSFDTETNGLHIIRCTPFLLAFGFVNPEIKEGHTYTLHFERDKAIVDDTMYALQYLFKKVEKVVAWNAKFDMHMMHNIGYPHIFKDNITDGMIYVRLAHDALSKSQGGVPDRLKDYAKQYITGDAKDHEKLIKSKQASMKKERTRKLKSMLEGIPLPKIISLVDTPYKSWTMGLIDQLLGDKVLGIEDLEPEVQKIINEWKDNTPDEQDYSNLPIDIVEPYAHYDVIYTLEAFLMTRETAVARGQQRVIKLEEELIVPLYEMERVGFAFNRDYALESKQRVKDYILNKREKLSELAGEKVTIGQHQKIKEVLQQKYKLKIDSTGAQVLAHLDVKNKEAQEFIDTISELRTLEKWYSTYITRFLDDEYNGRIYTSIKQTGAASGRVSSDFQQFPNKPIENDKGKELFHPRKMIKITGGKYSKILFIDYSQIELRVQALYTIMSGRGDRNLCRAYMPYHCIRKTDTGVEAFDPNNKKHLKAWNSGEWYLTESPDTLWEPVDQHTLTTRAAFPEIAKDDPEFPRYRKIGKQTNFACNYGASANTLTNTMNFSPEMAQKLYQTYVKSFPGVLKYRNQVQNVIDHQGYIENIYGRRYYGISGHLASNYLIQGSSADFLKTKIIEINKFLQDYNTRFQMNIHDELSFELHEDDPKDLPEKILKIMEDLPGTLVPIVADLEITDTTWADKRDYE